MSHEIMMPFWGRFDHLREAVLSVQAQDDPDWRLTVVDDVYPDLEPGKWVVALADPRITYVRNTENLRPSRNYNKCVRLATADYLTILGCDDVMKPGYVRRVKELLVEFPDADLIQPGVSVINERSEPTFPVGDRIKARLAPSGAMPRLLLGEKVAIGLMRGNWTYFPSLVWRRERLAGREFRGDLDVVQDLEMIMHILLDGGSIVVDDAPVFAYRRHSASVSAVTGPDGTKFAQERTLFAELERACADLGWTGAARAARHHITSRVNAASQFPAALRAKNPGAARSILRHVVVPGARRSADR